jgi:protein arginine N-methyltransferase 1
MPNYNDYSIDAYGSMIRDERRMGAFTQALRRAIQPGSVVLDIGAATGIFSFLACQYRAARVYAVEPDRSIDVARACAKGIPGAERITWIQGLTTEMDLPEKADVIVGDLHGVLPFFKGNLESMSDARKRHLKPGGRLIPARDVVHAVPAHAPDEYLHLQDPWHHNEYGLDFSPALPYLVNTWWRARSEPALPENLLASPQCWGEVPYATSDITGLDNTLAWEIERAGALHGLYVWFDGDLGDGIGYSNAPTLPEMVYGRAFFPLEQPVDVVPGDKLTARLTVKLVKGEYVYRWKSEITRADGVRKAGFDQSTFKASLLSPAQLRKGSADYVPSLTEEGRVAHAVLQGLASQRPLMEIARAIADSFPRKFRSADDALELVARLSKTYT